MFLFNLNTRRGRDQSKGRETRKEQGGGSVVQHLRELQLDRYMYRIILFYTFLPGFRNRELCSVLGGIYSERRKLYDDYKYRKVRKKNKPDLRSDLKE
jgi:hypothetical protein